MAVADTIDVGFWSADERCPWRLGERELSDDGMIGRHSGEAHRQEDKVCFDRLFRAGAGCEPDRLAVRGEVPVDAFDFHAGYPVLAEKSE